MSDHSNPLGVAVDANDFTGATPPPSPSPFEDERIPFPSDPDESPPLNMPVGSVRAILALTIVFAVVAFLIVGAFLLGTEFSLLAAGALIAIATQVVERYFGARSGS